MPSNILPFPIKEWSTNSIYATMVKQQFEYQGLRLLMVKTAAAMTNPGGRVVLWSDRDAGTVSGSADTLAWAGACAGLGPALLSGDVTSNAYMFVIVGGQEDEDGDGNSVACFSSAMAGVAGYPCVVISSGNLGISSGVNWVTVVAETDQITSSSLWATTQSSFCAKVKMLLG